MVTCAICHSSFECIAQLKCHMKGFHGESVITRLTCGEVGCGRSFDNWRVFRNHLVNKHKCVDKVVTGVVQISVGNDLQVVESSVEAEQDDHVGDDSECVLSPDDFQSTYSKSVEVLVAKLYTNTMIPRNFVQTLIDDIESFLTAGFIDILESKIMNCLTVSGVSQSFCRDIAEMFNTLKVPFKGLATDYKRMEHFKSNCYYVAPVEYTICESRPKLFNTSNGPVVKQVKTTGMFVPLRKVLKGVFELPGALSETLKYMNSLKEAHDVVTNVIQTAEWKRKIGKFTESDIVIPLNFYYDDVEPNADLGPHSEKLGAGYVTIPVLPPSCFSKLENIFLALLIDADDRKSSVPGKTSYNDEVFKPLIREFNFLEREGILCKHNIKEVRIFFVLDKIIGDNLGLHGILGFAEGFTANFPCILCRAPKEITRHLTREDQSVLRNIENYELDVARNDMELTGIKENCVFNQIDSFHVVKNLHVDFMHDGPEGCCHYVLIPILKHFVDQKYFTIEQLNSRMFFFYYGPSDSANKPVCISADFSTKSKLKGTAREILTLVRLLGVLIGDLVPECDSYWELYLLHRQIIEICLSKRIPLCLVDEFNLLVHEHHSLFMRLTRKSLPPKFHYFIHYGNLFPKCGPVSNFSSMRCESKHRDVVTKPASAISSRRNLPLSLATRHQLSMCFRFISKSPLLPEMIRGPGEDIELSEYRYLNVVKPALLSLPSPTESLHSVNWVDKDGTLYKPRMVLVLNLDPNGKFKFGKILDIVVVDGEPLFVCQVFKNFGFSEHVGGFEVQLSDKISSVFHHKLCDPFPVYDFMMNNGERYVVLKHYL